MKKSNFKVLIEKWNKGVRGIKGEDYFVTDSDKKYNLAITKGEKIVASISLNKKELKNLKTSIEEFSSK